MKHKKTGNRNIQEPETLTFHREMYERRLRKLKQRGGLSERELSDQVNTPIRFKRIPDVAEADAEKEGKEHSTQVK
jgi:hypothetical protein